MTHAPAPPQEPRVMKKLFLWYIPQATLFIGGYWFASTVAEPGSGGMGMAVFGLMLAAAYTGAANLIINLLAWLRGRSSLLGHDGQPSRDSLSLTGTGRGLPKATEQINRIRIRE